MWSRCFFMNRYRNGTNKTIFMRSKLLLIVALVSVHLFAQRESDFVRLVAFKSNEIDQLSICQVGEVMFSSGAKKEYVALRIKSAPKMKLSFIRFPYKKNDILPFFAFRKRKKYALFYNPEFNPYPFSDGTIGIAYEFETGEYLTYADYHSFRTKKASKRKEPLEVERTTVTINNCSECFKTQLIYLGREKNFVRFSYREFIGDMIRPAFTQELVYDLNETKIIGYKGVRIEIFSTSNTGITYKVKNIFATP